jgi:hypothetical protein
MKYKKIFNFKYKKERVWVFYPMKIEKLKIIKKKREIFLYVKEKIFLFSKDKLSFKFWTYLKKIFWSEYVYVLSSTFKKIKKFYIKIYFSFFYFYKYSYNFKSLKLFNFYFNLTFIKF